MSLHLGTRLLAFEADICTWWKSIPIQRFSEVDFHLFLRISAIGIVIVIDVIDLSHQIIELGKNRDYGYCEMLIWNLKDGAIIETFSCPRCLKELRFQWQQRPSIVQNKTKPFTAELPISGHYVR